MKISDLNYIMRNTDKFRCTTLDDDGICLTYHRNPGHFLYVEVFDDEISYLVEDTNKKLILDIDMMETKEEAVEYINKFLNV